MRLCGLCGNAVKYSVDDTVDLHVRNLSIYCDAVSFSPTLGHVDVNGRPVDIARTCLVLEWTADPLAVDGNAVPDAEPCISCEEAAEAQAKAMAPREIREGYAMIAHVNALLPYGSKPVPDVRLGDLVKVTLVAAAVPDAGPCEDCDA